MATSINTRLSDELEKKLNEVQEDIKAKAPRGAEVTFSSIVRGGLEKLIEEHEEEKKGVVTVKYDIKSMTDDELNDLETQLRSLYQKILNNRLEKNPIVKEENSEYYKEMRDFNSIQQASNEVFIECQRRCTEIISNYTPKRYKVNDSNVGE